MRAGFPPWASLMRFLIAVILACVACTAQADTLSGVQLLDQSGSVRAVFSLGAVPQAHVFTLEHPHRLVIDLSNVRTSAAVRRATYTAGVVKDVRFGRRHDGLRVVLDLKGAVHVDHFSLPAAAQYGHRLIVDITPLAGGSSSRAVVAAPARAKPAKAAATLHRKPVVVAVDAGHGGRDPGAHGPDGLQEKTVTLAIAKKLARLIDAQPGMKAVLTRKADNYVGLRERMVRARKADADIFVSIHCNAVRDAHVQGAAVYMLSQHGATSEQARWIAHRENAADMVGGIDISDKTSQLASVLVDISQSATIDASFDLASRLLHQMGRISPVLHAHVQRAAFVVLKAPDIPSVLVETDFITNPHEERLLGSSRYQSKIAHRLLTGIEGYFKHYRPKERVPLRTANRGELHAVDYSQSATQAGAAR